MAAEKKFNLKSLEHQKEAFKAEQAAERAKFDPIFQVRTLTNANGYIKIEIDSVRTNIIFLKFRANMNIAVSDYTPPSNHKKLVALKNTGATLYLGIEYKTMLGEDAIKVFTVDTSTARCEPATDHSGTNLPVQATFYNLVAETDSYTLSPSLSCDPIPLLNLVRDLLNQLW